MKRVAGGVGTLLLFALLVVLWPAKLGGTVSYVVTHGISMEPRFHTGDLAVVRSSGDYHVGEIVAYRSTTLHTTVLHRIVAMDGNRYVFKGDNNSWRDPDHPTRSQLIGRLWLHIPKAGTVLQWFATPLHALLLAIGVLLLFGGEQQRRRGRQRHHGGVSSAPPSWNALPPTARYLVGGLGGAAILLGALGAYADVHPAAVDRSRNVGYTAVSTFTYSGAVAPSVVYPNGRISTGDVIYTKLAPAVTVDVHVAVQSTAPVVVTGTASVDALVSLGTWQHAFPLVAAQPFRGSHVVVSAQLNFAALNATLAQVGTVTGMPASQYTVTVQPHIHLTGTVAGHPVQLDAPGTLAFTVTPTQAALTAQNGGQPKLTSTSPGTVSLPVRTPTTMTLLRHRLNVADTRTAGLVGGLGCAAAALGCWLYYRRRPADEAAVLRAQLGGKLVAISQPPTGAGTTVDVASAAALSMLAREYERLVLHHAPSQTYYVEDEGTVYRYHPRRVVPSQDQAPTVALIPRQPAASSDDALARLAGRHRQGRH